MTLIAIGLTLPTALNGRIIGTATVVTVEGKRVKSAGGLWWEWRDELGALVKPGTAGQHDKAMSNNV